MSNASEARKRAAEVQRANARFDRALQLAVEINELRKRQVAAVEELRLLFSEGPCTPSWDCHDVTTAPVDEPLGSCKNCSKSHESEQGQETVADDPAQDVEPVHDSTLAD